MSRIVASGPDAPGSRVDGNGHRPYHFSPLSQDDRVRKVFGLSDDAPLPPVSESSLAVFFGYLCQHLSLPFEGLYCQNGGEMRQLIHYLQVTQLIDPRQARNGCLQGLLCRAQNHKETREIPLIEVGVREESPNCQLMDDYAYWFVNCHV